MGVVRMVQLSEEVMVIEGTLDGLSTGPHGIHVHEFGDMRQAGAYIGGHYNPTKSIHGPPGGHPGHRHAGDLGNVVADERGRGTFRLEEREMKVWDIIGRAFAVTEGADDLGQGGGGSSAVDGNSGQVLACAIIARSAGLFQNSKKICTCDGKTLWEEGQEY